MNNTVILLIVLIASLIISFVLGIGAFVAINNGLYVPEWAPMSSKYHTQIGYRITGVSPLATYGDISVQKCMEKCEKNPACLSLVYKGDSGPCKIYNTNDVVDKDIASEFDGYDYYRKNYFWSRFTPQQTGSMKDFSGSNLVSKNNSLQECAVKCLKQTKDPLCQGFNFRSSDGYCKLLPSGLTGNEKYIDASATDYSFYGVLPAITDTSDIIKD